MTWTLVLTLAAGAYACKAAGLVVIGSRRLPPALERCLALVPAALISALVVMNTFSTGNDLVVDARAGRGRRRRGRGMAAGAARPGDRARGGRHRAGSTSCRSRLRLPRQMRRSTAVPPSRAAKRPPSHHGNCSSSRHVNRVRRPPSSGSSSNRPVPVTSPAMAHAHRPLGLPGGDLHPVVEAQRADHRLARVTGPDPAPLARLEVDRPRVGHPVDVALDRLEHPPHRARRSGEVGPNLDRRHERLRRARVPLARSRRRSRAASR